MKETSERGQECATAGGKRGCSRLDVNTLGNCSAKRKKRLKSRLDLRPSNPEGVGTTPTSLLQGRSSTEADNADYDDVGEKHLQGGRI
ncbi:hypothetical protein AGIG_G3320 [Arapaima gigas]